MNRKYRLLALTGSLLLVACTTSTTSTSTTYTSENAPMAAEKKFDNTKAAMTRLSLGLQYLGRQNMEAAKVNLDKAYEYAPKNGDVLYGMGYYYQQVREFDKAESFYKRALAVNPTNADYQNAYGAFLCRQGRYPEAEKLFLSAAESPTYALVGVTYENAGKCARDAGDEAKATRYLRKALTFNPRLPGALLEMSDIEFVNGRPERSEAYLLRYERVARHTPRSLWLGFRIAQTLGSRDAMANYALKLERMYPDSEETALYYKLK